MTDETHWELLARYVTGEATASERADVERRAAGDAALRQLVASLERRWQAAAASRPGGADVDAAWRRLAGRLSGLDSAQATPARVIALRPPGLRRAAAWRALPIAAAVVALLGAGLYWRARQAPHEGVPAVSLAAAGSELRTRIGERRTLRLSDGGEVILGAASSLRVDSGYGVRDRTVRLEGQALFRVRHDAALPFVVYAGGTRSEDLGTEFVVRAYPGDREVRVAVRQGSVALRRERDATDTVAVLRPRDVAYVEPTGSPEILHDQDLAPMTSWTTGTLVFDDAPLSDVAGELQRWYDIQVEFADSAVARIRYHGTHPHGERLDDILQAIGLSANVRIERVGRTVRFSRGALPSTLTAPPARTPSTREAGV